MTVFHKSHLCHNYKMNSDIQDIISSYIDDGVIPGAVVGYIKSDASSILPFGRFTYANDAPLVEEDTVYDVASITKSIPTATLLLLLAEQGVLSLHDRVIDYVPELTNKYRADIEIRHLLSYTVVFDIEELSSIASHGGEEILQTIFSAELKAKPGEMFLYTNAPAILAGLIIERATVSRLDQVAERELFKPLDMRHTTFHPRADIGKDGTPPTEINDRGKLQAVVHDEAANALQEQGIIAGNAGLFTNVPDLLKFCQATFDAYAGKENILNRPVITAMHANASNVPGSPYGLGWEIANRDHMGHYFTPATFGKTGFTGSSIIIDPLTRAAVVILTNNTYPTRPDDASTINSLRSRICDVILKP